MSKPKLTEARRPRGFGDHGPAEIASQRQMLETIRGVYERYGFEAVETPYLEYTEALGKFLPDTDRPNAGVLSVQDDVEQWMSLRYDLTAPLARYVAENFDKLPKPYRSYRVGPVFRNEKPGPGRFRQFMQFDADTVGASSVAADAENCMMFADAMEALGIPRGSYVVKVNNRKVLDGLLEKAKTRDEQKLAVLRAIDKADKFPPSDIMLLLTKGRMDESGDFTKGAGLDEVTADMLVRNVCMGPFMDVVDGVAMPTSKRTLEYMAANLRASETYDEGVFELIKMDEILRSAGFDSDRVRIDQTVVRGLEYYTGPVYEVELTFDVPDETGKPVRFGSVGGGGRYDGLIGRFRAEDVPATGISIGVSRLQAALTHLGKLKAETPVGPVVVTVMDRDRISDCQQMVSELRNAGIRAELYLGDAGFKAQMKYCDKRNAPLAIIQGGDEAAKGEVQIKDLVKGAALAVAAKTITDREVYKAMSAEAQYAVPRADLVAEVRKAMGI